jgi:hydrogenase maturation factor
VADSRYFPPGKLPQDLLDRLLGRIPAADPRLLVGAGVGQDAAVLDFGDTCLVAKTDPVTFATERAGWYAVNVNANDVACTGATPRWFLASLLLPEGRTDRPLVEGLFEEIQQACAELEITLCGGHTEITVGLERPLVIGCLLGEVPRERLVRNDAARPGDELLLVKGLAIEGTAILARQCAGRLSGIPAGQLTRAAGFLTDPGISVVDAARICAPLPGISALHDPTEGGLAAAVRELARLAGCGAELDLARVPVYPETRAVCAALGLDPLGLIASGALLVGVRPGAAPRVLRACAGAGLPAAVVGRLGGEGFWQRTSAGRAPLPEFEVDEIARFFSQIR